MVDGREDENLVAEGFGGERGGNGVVAVEVLHRGEPPVAEVC